MAILGTLDAGPRNESAFQKWLRSQSAGPAPTAGTVPSAPGAPPAAAPPAAPNYADLINSDPLYTQAKADLSAQGVGDAASRGAAIARGLVQFGIVPDLQTAASTLGLAPNQLGFLGQDVNDTVRQLANKNTSEGLSISARLRQAYEDEKKQGTDQLAARGMADSGESGYLLGRSAQKFKQAQSDAMSQLADYIRSTYGSFASSERDRQRQLADEARAAAERQAQFAPPPLPPAPPSGPNLSEAQALASLSPMQKKLLQLPL